MENTHEFKTVHDPLFCEEADIPAILPNPEEKDFFKNVHLVNSYGTEFLTAEKKFYTPGTIPACNPDNTCEVIQDFLEEDGIDNFSIFRSIQTECYDEIYQCQNRIESYKRKIRAEIQDIQAYKQKLNEAFNEYIE